MVCFCGNLNLVVLAWGQESFGGIAHIPATSFSNLTNVDNSIIFGDIRFMSGKRQTIHLLSERDLYAFGNNEEGTIGDV